MTLLEINFTTYIPTTLLGLLGLISGYLYFYFKNKDESKLKQIESANPNDRLKAIEMFLNELGVTIDTSGLDSTQKFILIGQILKAKTKKYLIISITAIILSGIVGFLVYDSNHTPIEPATKKDIFQPLKEEVNVQIDSSPKSIVIVGDSNKVENK